MEREFGVTADVERAVSIQEPDAAPLRELAPQSQVLVEVSL